MEISYLDRHGRKIKEPPLPEAPKPLTFHEVPEARKAPPLVFRTPLPYKGNLDEPPDQKIFGTHTDYIRYKTAWDAAQRKSLPREGSKR